VSESARWSQVTHRRMRHHADARQPRAWFSFAPSTPRRARSARGWRELSCAQRSETLPCSIDYCTVSSSTCRASRPSGCGDPDAPDLALPTSLGEAGRGAGKGGHRPHSKCSAESSDGQVRRSSSSQSVHIFPPPVRCSQFGRDEQFRRVWVRRNRVPSKALDFERARARGALVKKQQDV
jgi:hypothetical protein